MKRVDWRGAIAATGFATLPEVFWHEYWDRALCEINRSAPRRSRAGVRNALRLSPVAGVALHPEMMEFARAVLGADAFPFRVTLFDKSPAANWLVVWPEDTALPLQPRMDLPGGGPWSVKEEIDHAHAPAAALSQVLALRVSFDDSTAGNGPLRVLPGTHTRGVLSDDSIHELASQTPPVECTVPKGGVLAMRPLLVHASSKSQTEIPRRVLHIEYAASESIAKPFELAIA